MTKGKFLAVATTAVAALALASVAEAAVQCKPRVSGQGTGMGVAGQGSALARSNAMADWSNKAQAKYGKAFADSSKARSVTYDCRAGAILEAKCVVTAAPCGEVAAKSKPKSKRRR